MVETNEFDLRKSIKKNMKTTLIVLICLLFFMGTFAADRNKKTACPHFHSSTAPMHCRSAKTIKVTSSHRSQLKKQKPSSCRKKRRTGEVQRFLKIE